MAPPPPALPEELVEAILLRFPPDEPACLFRASLVCKPWCRLISGPGFRRRYRQFHRSPPLLGFLCGILGGIEATRFVPTSAFCLPLTAGRRQCRAVDAHHGRVLLQCPGKAASSEKNVLVVWDPISDEWTELPVVPTRPCLESRWDWNAAVLFAADSPCNHLDCHGRPFLVVFVDSHNPRPREMLQYEMSISTYSSDTGTWSDRIFPQQPLDYTNSRWLPRAHVGNALYFLSKTSNTALKYDLCLHEMSVIRLPSSPSSVPWWPPVLTNAEDGGLGCVTVHEFKLHMWSRKDGPQVDAGWTQDRIIDIEMLFRSNAIFNPPQVVSFTGGMGVFYLSARDLLFTVDLKTRNLNKVSKSKWKFLCNVLPYMSFYTPALGAACRGEGPSTVGSNA